MKINEYNNYTKIQMNKIFIGGSRASDKSSLIRLIDGNSNIGVIHHHDKFFELLNYLNKDNEFFKEIKEKVNVYNKKISNKKIGTYIKFKKKNNNFLLTPLLLRFLLQKTAFYEIEQNSLGSEQIQD